MSRMRWTAILAFSLLVAGTALGAVSAPAFADDGATVAAAAINGATAANDGSLLNPPGGPGRGRPGPDLCERLARAVHNACPCNGPDGAGWTDHAAFVECVAAALDAKLADNDNPRLALCATRILARATASQIGEPGFVCPTLQPRPGHRHPKPTPTADPGTDS